MATYTATLAAALPSIGFRAEMLAARPRLSRRLRWLTAAWPGPHPTRATPPGREAADVFRIAQVHFDLYGKPLALAGRQLPDLMHWTYPLPLRMRGRPNLYTVHDLIPLFHPALTGIDAPRFRRILQAVLRQADGIVTVSEATKQDLVRHLGMDPARIVNTGQAVDVSSAVDPMVPGLEPNRYWLHVGAVERRKNLPRLVEAWKASGTSHPLVIAGPDGWMAAELDTTHAGLHRIPWLDRPRLLGLIRDARALLMPSLAEGFGLPVAEAMALGTPVLTSRTGALAEVAGSAAMLIDPEDTAEMTAGLRTLDNDEPLRTRLSAQGHDQARNFTPAAYATRLAALYAKYLK